MIRFPCSSGDLGLNCTILQYRIIGVNNCRRQRRKVIILRGLWDLSSRSRVPASLAAASRRGPLRPRRSLPPLFYILRPMELNANVFTCIKINDAEASSQSGFSPTPKRTRLIYVSSASGMAPTSRGGSAYRALSPRSGY